MSPPKPKPWADTGSIGANSPPRMRNAMTTGRRESAQMEGMPISYRYDPLQLQLAMGLSGAGGRPDRRYVRRRGVSSPLRSEEHTSELQSQSNLVCRLLLEKKKKKQKHKPILLTTENDVS